MGCDRLQGFYFSKPLSTVDFCALLERNDTLPE
jgi:EAL domain-containing protein (putative c-di-GMP-specific phosphodiesterase class I)